MEPLRRERDVRNLQNVNETPYKNSFFPDSEDDDRF